MNKKSRRNILKGLAVGAPAVWAKPVVDSIVLPAHGATTGGAGCLQYSTTPNWVDFNGGNYIPGGSARYTDSECEQPKGVINCGFVYVPSGLQGDASDVCTANNNGNAIAQSQFEPTIWFCDCS